MKPTFPPEFIEWVEEQRAKAAYLLDPTELVHRKARLTGRPRQSEERWRGQKLGSIPSGIPCNIRDGTRNWLSSGPSAQRFRSSTASR